MKHITTSLSAIRIKRIRQQGYFDYTNCEITALAWGNRFAYILCTSIMIFAIATANISLLSIMAIITLLGTILPHHPFDYFYNYWLRRFLKRPKLPKRSRQLKFACKIATLWLGVLIFLFSEGYVQTAYVLGSMLIMIALLVSSIDLCIPSIIYNAIFKLKI